jgi:hypothetical protein
MFPDFGAQHLFVPLMKNPDTSRHITTPLEMRRSALRDRNEESGTEAIARIKAIAAGKTSRSAFLDDSDVESSPLSSVTGRAENKENDDEMSSDDESPVQPERRTNQQENHGFGAGRRDRFPNRAGVSARCSFQIHQTRNLPTWRPRKMMTKITRATRTPRWSAR